MNPRTIDDNDVVALYLAFSDGTGGKRRPILIVKNNHGLIDFMSITSQYTNKSSYIKRQYYPIQNWQSLGLFKPSYIDIASINRAKLSDLQKLGEIHYIGQLSYSDTLGLRAFVTSYLKEKGLAN